MRYFILLFLSPFLLISTSYANLFNSTPKFLKSEQAFIFSSQQDGEQLTLSWEIAEGYYLYKKEILITPINVEIVPPAFPPSERHHDEFFGDVEIFRHDLQVNVPLKNLQNNSTLEVQYQGCANGFCYPPETRIIPLQAVSSPPLFANNNNDDATALNAEPNPSSAGLFQQPLSLFWFFIVGLGLAFTPCVLPMLPLLSAIVMGTSKRTSNLRAFGLSLAYVQGMALTYTLLGLTVAAIGLPFQIALQSPPVLIGLSILFVILALSMFGLFDLRLPHAWQQKLNQLSQQQQGGSYPSVFTMGMIAGLVASPCTSAPLSSALLYVAQSGDLLTGAFALYLLALGMGIPLMLITLFGNTLLPKSGDWLLKVKTLFGFVMLALPIFLISRLVPSQFEPLLWSALAIATLIWLNEQISSTTWIKKVLKVVLLIGLIVCAKPWTDRLWQSTPLTAEQHTFTRITTLQELQQKLNENSDKKVMLDLYADWCVACKEFEKYTFSAPKVKAELDKMVVLQVDMTQNSAANDELSQQFQILGLPTILFFDETGKELSDKRITGFMSSDTFLEWLKQL